MAMYTQNRIEHSRYKNMHYYHAFQLNISSELLFPELLEGYPLAEADCHIRLGQVNIHGLDSPTKKTPFYQVAPHQFWLSINHVGRFLIEHGRTITLEPDPEADTASLRLFILGPCFSALLLQRGNYVLSGDVFSIHEQHTCAIVGQGGVGKSVLTQALLGQGHSLVSSGLCVIDSQGQVQPGYPRLQLWSDAIKLLSLEKPEQRIRPMLEKWYVTADHCFSHRAHPLRSIYLLSTHNQSNIAFTPLKGFVKFNQLRAHTTQPFLIEHMIDAHQYQCRGASLANQISITKITRPDHKDTVKTLIDILSHDLEGHMHEQ